MTFFAPFCIPFMTGAAVMFIVLLWKWGLWLYRLPLADKKRILFGLPTRRTFSAIGEVVGESLLHRRIFRVNPLLGYMHMSLAFGWFLLIAVGWIETVAYLGFRYVPLQGHVFFKYFAPTLMLREKPFFDFVMDLLLLNARVPEERRGECIRSAGRAGYATEIRVADPEGREVPTGDAGEILVRGPVVMVGYWGRPEETAQALHGGWLHTGDGGYMDAQGRLYVVDRLKDMIISGGENVYPAEVEEALGRHPAVATCAVIGVPSAKWGEAVHAVVVLREGAEATAEELRAHCRTRLGGYKCPESIEFRHSLPLSAAGKVLKSELRKSCGSAA